jgi:predicted SPOUT superfamily RNA methylase MTH1
MVLKSFVLILPTSLAADAPDLRQKTLKVGLIGRALAIFRVDQVCIYNDDDSNIRDQVKESDLITKLLQYMDTPQYLRKQLFPRTKELGYVGLLPPLRTPHHPLRDERTAPGDYREGIVVEVSGNQSLLEIGLPQKAAVSERLRVGQRLTVRLGEQGGDRIPVTPVTRAEVPEYWGYEVLQAETLEKGLSKLEADYVVGTSRRGQNLYEAVEGIKSNDPSRVAVAFGGPYRGLYEICERQGVDPGKLFDVVVNTVPRQGTETVRTEEALFATLALLNALPKGE